MHGQLEITTSEAKKKIHRNLFNTNQLTLTMATNFRTFFKLKLILIRDHLKWDSILFICLIDRSYDTNDGQSRDEELTILNKDTDEEEIVIKGSYAYTGTDGLIYRVDYTADRNGYHANVHKPVPQQSASKGLPTALAVQTPTPNQ